MSSKEANANFRNAFPGSNALPAINHEYCSHGSSAKALRRCTVAYWTKAFAEQNTFGI